jgi:hypothetical protein
MPRLSRASTNSGDAAIARSNQATPQPASVLQPATRPARWRRRPPGRRRRALAGRPARRRRDRPGRGARSRDSPIGRVVGIDLGGALKFSGRLARSIRVGGQQSEAVVRRSRSTAPA